MAKAPNDEQKAEGEQQAMGAAPGTTQALDPPALPPPPPPAEEPVDEDQQPAAPVAGYVIKVRGPEDGRWRAGIKFGPIEQEIDLSTITRAQAREIAEDSYLKVRRAD